MSPVIFTNRTGILYKNHQETLHFICGSIYYAYKDFVKNIGRQIKNINEEVVEIQRKKKRIIRTLRFL